MRTLSINSEDSVALSKLLVTPYTKPDFKWGSERHSEKWSFFQKSDKTKIVNELIKELEHSITKNRKITVDQATVYIRAIEAYYYNHGRTCIVDKKGCKEEAQMSILAKRLVTYLNNKEILKANALNYLGHFVLY